MLLTLIKVHITDKLFLFPTLRQFYYAVRYSYINPLVIRTLSSTPAMSITTVCVSYLFKCDGLFYLFELIEELVRTADMKVARGGECGIYIQV